MIEVKYGEKQKYYDKCKKWLLNDISNLVDIEYYKYTIKNLKLVDTQKGRYDVDITVTYKHFLNEEIHQYFLDKRIIF